MARARAPGPVGGGPAAPSFNHAPPAATDNEAAQHEHGEHGHGDAAKSANLKKAGEAKIGDTQACPISGEEFVVSETSPKSEYNGKTYFFCCAGCKKKFEADPKKAVEKLGS